VLVPRDLPGGRAVGTDRQDVAVQGWPDAEAVETDTLKETDGVTKLTVTMVFRDKAGRDHMTKHDGQESSFDKLEDYLMSLLGKEETP
jgi:hypothetical protein